MGVWAFLKYGLPIGAVLLLAAYGTGYWRGKSVAERACETASLRAEIAKLKHEKAVAEAAEAEAESGAAELAKEKAELERKVSEYAEKLAKNPNAVCAVTDDDLGVMQ